MRKVILIIIAVLAIGAEGMHMTDETKSRVWEVMQPDIYACLEEIGKPIEDLRTWAKQESPGADDHCFAGCLFKKRGLINEAGMFDLAKAVELQEILIDDEEERTMGYETIQPCISVNEMDVSDGVEGCDRGRLLTNCISEEVIKRHGA